jgi:glycogen operon protein
MQMDGRAQATGIRQRGSDATLLLVLNAHHDVVQFTLPECAGCEGWTLLVDTNLDEAGDAYFKVGHVYDVTARSLLLLAMQPAKEAG